MTVCLQAGRGQLCWNNSHDPTASLKWSGGRDPLCCGYYELIVNISLFIIILYYYYISVITAVCVVAAFRLLLQLFLLSKR